MSMTAEQARTIIKQAKKDETYEGPVPKDDDKAVEEAQGLVDMAAEAWGDNIRGPEVEKILKLHASFENGGEPEDDDEEAGADLDNMDRAALKKFIKENDLGIKVTRSMDDDDIRELIKAEIEDEEEPEDEEPEEDEEEETADDEDEDEEDTDDVAKAEPWEGYDGETVKDIKGALEEFKEEDDDFEGLLAHVWAYESENKNRPTVLKALEAYKEEDDDDEGVEEEETDTGEDEKPSADSEEDEGGEDGDEDGEEDGEEDEDADRAGTSDAEDDDEPEAEEEDEEGESPDAEAGEEDEGGDDEYRDLIKAVEKRIASESFYIPPKLTDAPPEVPFDVTEMSDKELQTLYGAFSAYAVRAGYLERLEESKARICRNAADEIYNALLAESEKIDPKTKKEKTATILKAEIESDKNVKTWRKRQHRHEAFQHGYKTDKENYNRMLESLSRLETMRHNEYERSGGLKARKK